MLYTNVKLRLCAKWSVPFLILYHIFVICFILPPAVSNFFVCCEVNRSDVIPVVLEKLSSFLCWFQKQTSLRLFATSLLIIYEGDRAPGSAQKPSVDIRLVDFAHTYKCTGSGEDPDENWLFGLENFIRCLMRLTEEIATPYTE